MSFNKNILGQFQNSHCAKTCALLESPTFSPDDRQALDTIISLWPGLVADMKIGILCMIESASKVYAGR